MRLLSKIFGLMFAVGKDKYMHIVVGSFIASLSLIVFCFLPLWANLIISVLLVLSSALIKDLVIDDKPDWVDIVCTWFGGALLWLPVILLTF